MNYRQRCYDQYVQSQWKNIHSGDKEEYLLLAKTLKIRFKNFLPPDRNARILDVACGAGHYLFFLQNEGYSKARGIDISKEQLDLASKQGVHSIEQQDMFSFLEKNPGSFDVILANDILEHLDKEEVLRFLDLAYQALDKNGILILSTVNAQSIFGAGDLYSDFTHLQGFTSRSLTQVMSICGFNQISVFGEKPSGFDLKSKIRCFIWEIISASMQLILKIEKGFGRGFWKSEAVFESRIWGVGRKKSSE